MPSFQDDLTDRKIMSAILQTRGPIVTPAVVKSNCNSLHMMTTSEFLKAAQDLHNMGLGTLASIGTKVGRGGTPATVYVKKPLEDIEQVLEANPDLCGVEYYATRYNLSASKAIGLGTRFRVAEMGLVSQKLLMQ